MGIILNDGVRQPDVDLQRLHFAADTPYETEMTLKPQPQRVMAPEIAKTLRQALMGVVMEGTATRLRGAYHAPNGTLLPVGGKTGTGDNRLDRFGRGGHLISQHVVDRTATFVFFLAIDSSARSPLMFPVRSPALTISPALWPCNFSEPSNRSSMRRQARPRQCRSARPRPPRPG
jgi:hypothetical protein